MTERHPLRSVAVPGGDIAWREAGARDAPVVVLLHGIGSGSGTWQGVMAALSARHRLLAWDAPGYGGSTAQVGEQPTADDYAMFAESWLEACGAARVHLVGHSLGAIVAATIAGRGRVAVESLVLASPAAGYGSASADVRAAKLASRLDALGRLGIAGMADARSAALCAPGAPEIVIDEVRRHMSRITPTGYARAAWLLAHDDLRLRLRTPGASDAIAAVICGSVDAVTPPAAARALARDFGVGFTSIEGAAHALSIEAPEAFAAALEAAWQTRAG